MNAAALTTIRHESGNSPAPVAAVRAASAGSAAIGVASQLIINRELGLNFNENPWQGSFVVDELTDLVEEAVYKEFEAISERGGVLGALDTMYQRGKIQEGSLYYQSKKHDGSLPLIGVNTFLPKEHAGDITTTIELIRSTPHEKDQQIHNVEALWKARNERAAMASASNLSPPGRGRAEGAGEGGLNRIPEHSAEGAKSKGDDTVEAAQAATGADGTAAHGIKPQSGDPKVPGTLTHLQSTARARQNLLEALLKAVKYNSLGQISHALYDVGGEYRRKM